MGIIKKTSIPNTIIHYLGFIIGFINVIIVFPNVLSADEFGLTRLFISIASIYIQLSSFGIKQINVKFFPFFKTSDNKHHGLVVIGLIISTVGFLIMSGLYILFKNNILGVYEGTSSLFIDNYYIVIPFAFFLLYFEYFDSYLQAQYKTIFTNFLRNILLRLIWLSIALIYYYDMISFNQFILLFISGYLINLFLILIYLIVSKRIYLSLDKRYLRKRIIKRILNYGFFQFISGMAGIVIYHIDKIMISFMLYEGLKQTAVYAIGAYMCSILVVPVRQIIRVTFPIITNNWKRKNLDSISEIYRKSSINLLLIGGFIFIVIWINMSNLIRILPEEYFAIRYVFLFLAIGELFNMATSVNNAIIIASKYYRFNLVLSIILIAMTIITNIIFIPVFGIKGAAIATSLTIIVLNLIRYLFVLYKLRMQPFTINTFWCILIIIPSILISYIIPEFENIYFDIFIRSGICIAIFVCSSYFLKVSTEYNEIVNNILRIRPKDK